MLGSLLQKFINVMALQSPMPIEKYINVLKVGMIEFSIDR